MRAFERALELRYMFVVTHSHRWVLVAGLAACSAPNGQTVPMPDAGTAVDASTADGADGGVSAGPTQVAYDFGKWTIPAGGEQYPCTQWTLNNDEPLYVNAVVQANDGGWHHSNWYAVEDSKFEGPDGIVDCDERGFDERVGAVFGTVLFAQSTQAYVETQRLPEGVVIKIPPRSKIMAGAHLINASTSPLETGVRMGLELVHPRDVETIAMPWRLDNSSLEIPAGAEVRFETACTLDAQYEFKAKEPFAPKVFWVLPHYHALGNYFRLDILRPEGDETLFELEGFNAEANGITYNPPIDLAGSTGLRFSCGYHNTGPRPATYGLAAEDEMCTMLLFTDAAQRLNTAVWELSGVGTVDGIETRYGDCSAIFLPTSADQSMPTEEEIAAPLYVPEGDAAVTVEVVPNCVDAPRDAEPDGPTTLESLRTDIFVPSCTYSSCHDTSSPAANLDFLADDLRAELLEHTMTTDVDMRLVAPGEPENSWLYHVTSRCEPRTSNGVTSFMPRNSPTLLSAGKIARLRQWIADGAR